MDVNLLMGVSTILCLIYYYRNIYFPNHDNIKKTFIVDSLLSCVCVYIYIYIYIYNVWVFHFGFTLKKKAHGCHISYKFVCEWQLCCIENYWVTIFSAWNCLEIITLSVVLSYVLFLSYVISLYVYLCFMSSVMFDFTCK